MTLLGIPNWFIAYGNVFALLAAGWISETHYTSRIALFTNGVALSIHYIQNLDNGFFGAGLVGFCVSAYALIGFISGSVGFLAYWNQEKLPALYYELNHFAYRSTTVAGVILVTGLLEHFL